MKNSEFNRVVHVAGDALLQNTGFSQQFFIEIKELKNKGYDVSVLAFCHLKNFRRTNLIEKLREKYEIIGIKIYIVPIFLTGRLLFGFIYFPISWIIFTYLIFNKNIHIFHFHESYYLDMFLIPKLIVPKNIKVFNDIHGVVIEESIYQGKIKNGSLRHKYFNFMEKLAIKYADLNFCVSNNMIAYYANKHNVNLNSFRLTRSSFDPTIFKDFSIELKNKSKKVLGLENNKVLLYMGHKRSWQQTKEVLNLFAFLKKHIDDLFLVFLTDDIESIKYECRQLGIEESDCIIKYVSHEEVPIYSYSADAAIIIRDDSIVNKVASPVKFSEYLASGAAVIISNNIGDLPSIVSDYNIGILLLPNGYSDVLSYLKGMFQNIEQQQAISLKCREIAEKEFSANNTIDTFNNSYNMKY